MRTCRTALLGFIAAESLIGWQSALELPGHYFRLLDAGIVRVEQQLAANPTADLKTLEARSDGWRLFPHTILVAAVLYTKQNAVNHRYQDPRMLRLALRIGDLLAAESEHGSFQARLNSDRDTYMWLDAYRIL